MAVPSAIYNSYISEGEKLTDDKEDAPIIALALTVGRVLERLKHL